jgi:aspartate aminotransferase
MFSYTGLTKAQVKYLNDHYHIYMPLTGRMVMTGLNQDNIDYVAHAIDDAIRKFD